MKQKLMGITVSVAMAAGAAGCSGFNPGVSQSKNLNELSDEEAKTLCEDTQTYYEETITDEDFKQFGCYISGQIAGATSASDSDSEFDSAVCEETVDECLAQESEDGLEREEIDCSQAQVPEECDVAVSEYVDCIEATVEDLQQEISELTCEEPLEEETEEESTIEECQNLPDNCSPVVSTSATEP